MDTGFRKMFIQFLAQTSNNPLMLEVEKASGHYLFTPAGEKYFDLISGISVSNVGHCHPKVVDAIQRQASTFMHTMVFGEHVQPVQVQLAEKISKKLPFSEPSVYFVNSGSEATEGAMKLAKRATGRYRIASAEKAYHGSTQGALSLMSETYYNQAYRPLLPGIDFIGFNNIDSLDIITNETAAVFIELIQGEAGYINGEPSFLKALYEKCQKTGALLIVDEIQTGYGRTGSFLALNQTDIVPDIILMAKGMGGGMPLGAFAAEKSLMSCLSDNPVLGHITTFGGHPVSCAASLAVLQILENENLISQVKEKENYFRKQLVHPQIRSVSGKGLMLGIELKDDAFAQKVILECYHQKVLTDWFLYAGNKLRIAPPLTITENEINMVCEVIIKAMDKMPI